MAQLQKTKVDTLTLSKDGTIKVEDLIAKLDNIDTEITNLKNKSKKRLINYQFSF